MFLTLHQINPSSNQYLEAIDENGYAVIENFTKGEVIKFGYHCESKADQMPIYLKIDNDYKEFQIGQTGTLEIAGVNVTGIKIPKNINFTFEYICEE